MISIQDYIIEQKPKIANLISITINSIELNTCAQIKVLFYNNEFQIIDNKLIIYNSIRDAAKKLHISRKNLKLRPQNYPFILLDKIPEKILMNGKF